jgi:hypothetical protein
VFDVTKDLARQVMVPPGIFSAGEKPCRDSARKFWFSPIGEKQSLGYEEGLPMAGDGFFALFMPPKQFRKNTKPCHLHLRLFYPEKIRVETAALLYLAPFDTLHCATPPSPEKKLQQIPG